MANPPTFHHRARKRFGQNFLHDTGVIQRIIQAITPQQDQHLVEIGPGQGALTASLVASGSETHVIELDRDLVPGLLASFASYNNFHLHQGDALKFDFKQLADPNQKIRVIGNLPYNISTPLLFHLFSFRELISDMHFMLQKEVVERLAAQPGEKAYGRLGIMAQYFCQIDYLFTVNPGAFKPAPKVDSAIVKLTPHRSIEQPAEDIKQLEQVVKLAFSQRRKTIRNTLKSLFAADELHQLAIDPTLRPEQITLSQFISLANYLAKR
ncbi:16S rRNA (adenine(1518)-N(6)/adenine(1519)-N(6))-dimethyltransferase RsmA [Endozoicomonas sp. SM1973]|uniref:Ribosomal RNA small subunit methyltransferase A n=1 Tax=Spartinivicinus marinus TaxID=2994442 RepID=A0A853IEF7_9GAMM|nr:16S rRNA (adenine(1518)-N(6)/adenine(1519)-N(6))-dimethyltransferase RsmA [Spartinivicinus marinus]MCX4028023.1 16S rRNA (adenine(1518)-N(6)/adenine(1519)-N(6))-dimethyltransferase RsmA [Spartinivicinus marinus]NYZ68351.1 16S rRNA (adenine(1518)-N(6)/adenine(1519)-N(6))-dimethyltransferase RsmA [Spartinivicinus marinus]